MTTCNSTKPLGNTGSLTIIIRGVLLTAVLGCMTVSALAEDWLFARGGIDSTGVAASELPEAPEVLWRYEVKESGFEAAVVVKDGIAYLGDVDGTFHAVNIDTGKAVWTKAFDDSGFLSPAAIEGDHLFVGDYNGVLYCLALADGAIRWQVELAAEVMAGPLVNNGKVLVTTEGGTFTVHDAATGEKQGEFIIDAPLRCMPTVVGGLAMLAGCDGKLHAIDITTAKEVDSVEIDGPTGSTAAAIDKLVYFGTEEGTFYAIDTAASPPKVLWTFADKRRKQGIRTAAAVNDTVAVFGSQGKAVFAVKLATGEPAWTFPTRTRVESSPLIAGKYAIAATQRGKLFMIDLATGNEAWQYDAGGNFLASPVVVDGKLLIANSDRSAGTLYCFGSK